jgi:hypothetical protein
MSSTLLLAPLGLAMCLLVCSASRAQDLPFSAAVEAPSKAQGPKCKPAHGSGAPPGPATVTVVNDTGASVVIHLGFNASSCYQPDQFSSFCSVGSNQHICTFDLDQGASRDLVFSQSQCTASIAIAVNQDPWKSCSNSFAELTVHDY